MIRRLSFAALLCALLNAHPAAAITCSSLPYTFTNGTLADATQVNQNFTTLLNCTNALDASSVTTGTLAILHGGTGQTATPIFSTSNPSPGGAITAASQLMFGLNTGFTPASTGKMKLTVTGTLTMGATAQAYTLQLRSAAGAAPTFGVAASGTVLSAATWSSVANSQTIQFSFTGIITLTAGVASWVDLSALTSGGASAGISGVTVIIDEKPI